MLLSRRAFRKDSVVFDRRGVQRPGPYTELKDPILPFTKNVFFMNKERSTKLSPSNCKLERFQFTDLVRKVFPASPMSMNV